MHSPLETSKNKVLRYRKCNLLTINKGFGYQAFNICFKYIWNGIVPEKLNSLRSIKDIILTPNLRIDLKTGRTHSCNFSTNFLFNPFV